MSATFDWVPQNLLPLLISRYSEMVLMTKHVMAAVNPIYGAAISAIGHDALPMNTTTDNHLMSLSVYPVAFLSHRVRCL